MKFEDVEIGQTVRTEGRTITEADIVNFAGVSGDFYYPHTNEEKMKQILKELTPDSKSFDIKRR